MTCATSVAPESATCCALITLIELGESSTLESTRVAVTTTSFRVGTSCAHTREHASAAHIQRIFLHTELSGPPCSPSVCIRTGWGKGCQALGRGDRLSKTCTRRPSCFLEGTGPGSRLLASGSIPPQSLLALSFRRQWQSDVSDDSARIPGYSGGTAAGLHRIPCFPGRAAHAPYSTENPGCQRRSPLSPLSPSPLLRRSP